MYINIVVSVKLGKESEIIMECRRTTRAGRGGRGVRNLGRLPGAGIRNLRGTEYRVGRAIQAGTGANVRETAHALEEDRQFRVFPATVSASWVIPTCPVSFLVNPSIEAAAGHGVSKTCL
jgi:hypothetical protein